MIRRLLQRLRRSEEGGAAVELAIVAPFLATLLIGVVDLTTAVNRKLEMEQALQRSLEKIMNTTTNTTPTQNITKEVSDAVPGITVEDVSVDYLLECNNVIQPQSTATPAAPTDESTEEGFVEEPDASAGCPDGQIQRRYITAKVTDDFEPVFPLDRLGMKAGTFRIVAEVGVRLE